MSNFLKKGSGGKNYFLQNFVSYHLMSLNFYFQKCKPNRNHQKLCQDGDRSWFLFFIPGNGWDAHRNKFLFSDEENKEFPMGKEGSDNIYFNIFENSENEEKTMKNSEQVTSSDFSCKYVNILLLLWQITSYLTPHISDLLISRPWQKVIATAERKLSNLHPQLWDFGQVKKI